MTGEEMLEAEGYERRGSGLFVRPDPDNCAYCSFVFFNGGAVKHAVTDLDGTESVILTAKEIHALHQKLLDMGL